MQEVEGGVKQASLRRAAVHGYGYGWYRTVTDGSSSSSIERRPLSIFPVGVRNTASQQVKSGNFAHPNASLSASSLHPLVRLLGRKGTPAWWAKVRIGGRAPSRPRQTPSRPILQTQTPPPPYHRPGREGQDKARSLPAQRRVLAIAIYLSCPRARRIYLKRGREGRR